MKTPTDKLSLPFQFIRTESDIMRTSSPESIQISKSFQDFSPSPIYKQSNSKKKIQTIADFNRIVISVHEASPLHSPENKNKKEKEKEVKMNKKLNLINL